MPTTETEIPHQEMEVANPEQENKEKFRELMIQMRSGILRDITKNVARFRDNSPARTELAKNLEAARNIISQMEKVAVSEEQKFVVEFLKEWAEHIVEEVTSEPEDPKK